MMRFETALHLREKDFSREKAQKSQKRQEGKGAFFCLRFLLLFTVPLTAGFPPARE